MSECERGINELKLAGFFDKDADYEGMIGEAVKELLEVFSKQGHSGFSAQLTASIFQRLIKGETLAPLTGKDDEWTDVTHMCGDELTYQNKRNSAVFKDDDGAYYIDGRVFVHTNGVLFTCQESKVPVTFPCVPKTEHIHEGTPEAEPFKHLFEQENK